MSDIDNLSNESDSTTKSNDFIKEFFDFIRDIAIILVIVFVTRIFIIEPFKISWESMNSTYSDGQFIIVNKIAYINKPILWQTQYKRWDVVVIKPWVNDNKEYYIKRVIWLPWEQVKISWWKVYIRENEDAKFEELKEWYLDDANKDRTYQSNLSKDEVIYTVPEEAYFVMWDNRMASTDSRACFYTCMKLWGWRDEYIKEKDVVWKVWFDFGYFNFKKFKFENDKWTKTTPKFFGTPSSYDYNQQK